MKRTNVKKGFTLVEILFVLALISIVVGIGISQMSGATDAAQKTLAKSDVRAMILAQHIAFSEGATYGDETLIAGNLPNSFPGKYVAFGDANDFCVSVEYATGKYVGYTTSDSVGIDTATGNCTAAATRP